MELVADFPTHLVPLQEDFLVVRHSPIVACRGYHSTCVREARREGEKKGRRRRRRREGGRRREAEGGGGRQKGEGEDKVGKEKKEQVIPHTQPAAM